MVLIENRGFTPDIRNTNAVQGFFNVCNELEENSSSQRPCLSISSWIVSGFTSSHLSNVVEAIYIQTNGL